MWCALQLEHRPAAHTLCFYSGTLVSISSFPAPAPQPLIWQYSERRTDVQRAEQYKLEPGGQSACLSKARSNVVTHVGTSSPSASVARHSICGQTRSLRRIISLPYPRALISLRGRTLYCAPEYTPSIKLDAIDEQ